MTQEEIRLANAIRRVKAVAGGGTINGVYRTQPIAALDAFRADLHLLTDHIIGEQG